jgi:hypothetical protein
MEIVAILSSPQQLRKIMAFAWRHSMGSMPHQTAKPACWADSADPEHDQRGITQENEERRAAGGARGELIDEAALAAALKEGQVAAAALDVFVNEPLKDSPLQKLENAVLTPHIAGSTNEAQEAVGHQIALQVKEYLKHGVIQNAVNVPSVSHDEYVKLKPYITLAERLGSFLAQISGSSVEEIALSYTGHITEWKTELIRNAAIKGILNVHVEEKANLVNAASQASERGLTISERKPGVNRRRGKRVEDFDHYAERNARGQGRCSAREHTPAAACGWDRH